MRKNEIKENDTSKNPYVQFSQWLLKQPYWLQDATWRLYNNQPIDENRIASYARMCIDQSEGKDIIFQSFLPNLTSDAEKKLDLVIQSIYDVKNVNALADGTCLDFGEQGLTVVYGLNGAGKSGFMRIIKHVSNNPYAEAIQPNIYGSLSDEKSACCIDITINGIKKTIVSDLEANEKSEYLQQCDVFDTGISRAYVSTSNNVSYEPFIFSVLRKLAKIADQIHAVINEKTNAIQPIEIDIPDEYVDKSYANWLKDIGSQTIIPSECLDWTPQKEERMKSLQRLLDTKQVEESLRTCRYQNSQIRKVLTELQDLRTQIVENAPNKLRDQYNSYCTAKRQYEIVRKIFTEDADEQDKISISISDWKTLWQVGRSYYEKCIYKRNSNHFATEGSICPLCLQPLEGKYLKRFTTIDDYVNGSASETLKRTKQEYIETLKKVLSHTYNALQVRDLLDGVVSQDTCNAVTKFYKKIEKWEADISSSETFSEVLSVKKLLFIDELDKKIKEINSKIESLQASLTIENKESNLEELRRLQYDNWVYQRREMLYAKTKSEKEKQRLNNALQYCRTNRITTESNQLAETLISQAYIQRFNSEINLLAHGLKVKLERVQSQKGQSPYKIVLDSSNKLRSHPETVLSEGEQRIVALAAFFADATGRYEHTPVIIDDPISSLDYNYEEAATKRIVELAKHRQVIIFTHRISLLVGLSEQCKNNQVQFYERYIRSTKLGNGVRDFEDVYHGNITKQLNGLANRVQQLKKQDPGSIEYADGCSRISQQIRICVERSVEDVLFQGMVKRFSRRIMTRQLTKMDRITLDDCKRIDNMMTKYSFNEHSQPDDSPLITMDLDEVINDINCFVEWIKAFNKKMG